MPAAAAILYPLAPRTPITCDCPGLPIYIGPVYAIANSAGNGPLTSGGSPGLSSNFTISATLDLVNCNTTVSLSITNHATLAGTLTVGMVPDPNNTPTGALIPATLVLANGTATGQLVLADSADAALDVTGNSTLGNFTTASFQNTTATITIHPGATLNAGSIAAGFGNQSINNEGILNVNGNLQVQGTFSNGTTNITGNLTLGTFGFSGAYNLGANASLAASGNNSLEIIGDVGTGTFLHTGGTNTTHELDLGETSNGIGIYTLSGNSTLTTTFEEVGYDGKGTFSQSGGTNSVFELDVGEDQGSTGNYTLSNGSLPTNDLEIGWQGHGTFTHSGGTVTLFELDLGGTSSGTGNYTLSGNASLTSTDVEFIGDGGTAAFVQTGGTNSTPELDLADGGFASYSLSNGSLSVTGTSGEIIGYGGNATFTQSGGSHLAYELDLAENRNTSATYTLSNGSLTVTTFEIVGYDGAGTFTQTGGTHTVHELDLGSDVSSTGTFTLSNGSLTATLEFIGDGGNSTFTQSGGSNTIAAGGSLSVGDFDTSSAYTLSNGSLTVNGTEYIGGLNGYILGTRPYFNNGTLTQSGGNHTITGQLQIGPVPGASGAFLLGGGSLSVNGNISLGGSNGTPGGTGILTLSNTATLTSTGSLTTYNTANTTLTINGGFLTLTALINNAPFLQTAGNASLGNVSGNGTLTLTGGHATAASLHAAALSLANTAVFKITPPANATASTLTSLTFAGTPGNWTGALDLTTSKLILEATSSTKAATLATLEDQAAFGRSHAAGITSSTLPAHTTIAVVDNAALATPFTTFSGVTVDANSILIAPELLGDANIDGHVDLNDLNTVLNNLGTTTALWTNGNFDGAPAINLNDLNAVLNNLGTFFANNSAVLAAESLIATTTPTPEPASIALLTPALLLLPRRRKITPHR